jgi:ribonuclease BN (tRNA processing enzyme)
VDHPTPAFGIRVTDGERTFAYTGDTGPCTALDELARGADVLLSEASWTDAPDRPAGVHLSGKQAGEVASRAGAGRLLLTHIAPWTDRAAVLAEAVEAFGAAVAVEQGGVYEV